LLNRNQFGNRHKFQTLMAKRLLLSHSLSCFSDRLWDFAFPVLLARFHPEHALFVAALCSLSGQCATFFLCTLLGQALDASKNQLSFVSTALALQNGSTVLLSLSLLLLNDGAWLYLCAAALSVISSLASLTERVIVEQEWAPVLMHSQSEARRLVFNAQLRQVYLVTKICAPVLVGLVVGFFSSLNALLFVCGWNGSCVVEMRFLRGIWHENNELWIKETKKKRLRKKHH
jgi:hypothetical protein